VIYIFLLLFSTAHAAPTRSVDADTITSSDKTKTFSLPSTTATLVGRTTADTLQNKTISGSNNTLTQVPIANDFISEVPTGTINGSNVTFTLANTPVAVDSVQVFLNGIVQIRGAGEDYTLSGNTITFITAPATGQSLRVVYPRY
jgi:hypothetical protein